VFAPLEAENFFKKQVKEFDDKLSAIERELVRLATETGAPVPEEKMKSNLLIQQNLEGDLNKLINSYVEKKRFVHYIENELKSNQMNLFTFIDSVNIGDFGKKLQDLLIEREKIKKIYADESPPVKAINEQINTTYKAFKNEIQRYVEGELAKLKAMEEAIQSMSERLGKIRNDNVKLYQNSIKSKALERELKIAEESFTTFMKRWNEARIDRSSNASNLFTVSVISEATGSLSPVFPKKKLVIPVGFLLAIIVGVTMGFIVEFFDHRFKRPEDVERYAGFKTLFSIPKF
jgi:capsular polysaccharide biosynthesis protein